jgi:dCMP deaminase
VVHQHAANRDGLHDAGVIDGQEIVGMDNAFFHFGVTLLLGFRSCNYRKIQAWVLNAFILTIFFCMNNNPTRTKLRDEVYTQMMVAQARLSKDKNTQMGAVLVSADGRVISTGYNGAPAGFDDETVPYTREKQKLAYDLLDADTGEVLSHHEFEANKYPFMVHAEINALHYARGKVPPGSKLYVIGFPCERCALDVSLSGVAEVFVTKDDYDPKSTLNNSRDTAYYMFAQAGIVVTLCGKRIRPVVSKPAGT